MRNTRGGTLGDSNTKPLVFLGTCLAFAETVLGALAGFADTNATLVAGFAIVSLGMVLLALVLMYWRDPAFLTLTGQQALELRRLQEMVAKLPPELIRPYIRSLMVQDVRRGQSARIAGTEETTEQDAEELETELGLLNGTERQRGNQ
jgi:hypothetical protein